MQEKDVKKLLNRLDLLTVELRNQTQAMNDLTSALLMLADLQNHDPAGAEEEDTLDEPKPLSP